MQWQRRMRERDNKQNIKDQRRQSIFEVKFCTVIIEVSETENPKRSRETERQHQSRTNSDSSEARQTNTTNPVTCVTDGTAPESLHSDLHSLLSPSLRARMG